MLSNSEIKELKDNGYVVIPYTDDTYGEIREFEEEIWEFNDKNYTDSNLESGVAYPSDSSDTRESNAYLVSQYKSKSEHWDIRYNPIPNIPILPWVDQNLLFLVRDWNTFLGQMSGNPDPLDETVSLINMQEYLGYSKTVPAHQDGMYFKMHDMEFGTFGVTEALIAEYVGVLILTNEGRAGTILTEVGSGLTFHPPTKEGEMLIFDNIRFTHEVPPLVHKRSMVGIRNWNHNPYHYTQERGDSKLTHTVGNNFFKGYIRKVTTEEAENLFVRDGKTYTKAPF
jgi:hypothetical protein